MNFAQRVAANVKRLREKIKWSVETASKQSFSRFGDDNGITVPRWYRLEQGRYPGMIGEVIERVGDLLGVDASELTLPPPEEEQKTQPSMEEPQGGKQQNQDGNKQRKQGGKQRKQGKPKKRRPARTKAKSTTRPKKKRRRKSSGR